MDESKQEPSQDPKAMTKEEFMENFPAEYKIDLDNLPRQKHNWVRRGISVTCGGAGHPPHRHFLYKP